MAASGHTRKSLSIAFLAISDQIRNFFFKLFFSKWRPAAILEVQLSLLIAFLAISDQYATFFLPFFSKWRPAAILEVQFGPFWMIENHFRLHFSSFQINTQLLFFYKMATSGHFGCPISPKNNRVLPLCVINGYAKYEVDR